MKKMFLTMAAAVSLILSACQGSENKDTGKGNKPDTADVPGETDATGRTDNNSGDTTKKNIGPGKDKYHITDSEDKKKH